jgi:hypothetical protein
MSSILISKVSLSTIWTSTKNVLPRCSRTKAECMQITKVWDSTRQKVPTCKKLFPNFVKCDAREGRRCIHVLMYITYTYVYILHTYYIYEHIQSELTEVVS